MQTKLLCVTIVLISLASCKKEEIEPIINQGSNITANITTKAAYTGFPETFETGSKTAYSIGDITAITGVWTLDDALMGSTASDSKNGAKSIRIRAAGKLTMKFDLFNGISTISISHAKYGADAAGSWTLWVSQDGGNTWVQVGNTIASTSNILETATFTPNITGTVRLEIRKTSSSTRINIDDISIEETAGPTRDDHMTLGNPSAASTDPANMNNYLLQRGQFSLSYNNSKGGANWVSWHLSPAWKGTAIRTDKFLMDNLLPTTFYRPSGTTYSNSGFDRGHQCPADDRDGSQTDIDATFYMSNMLPQAPNANRVTWKNVEDYCRQLIDEGNELYIITGGYGTGGTGSLGGITNTIDAGRINVPARLWKVIVVLPIGSNDAARVNSNTRIIAVDVPNTQSANALSWCDYRTSVDAIEAVTGLDLLSNVSTSVQSIIESYTDLEPIL